jgi:hypothetical protein
MGNIVCDNYYCHSVSYKPEWFSESTWNIDYLSDNQKKPFTIDKGVLKIKDTSIFNMILSKKIFMDIDEIKEIHIPLHFKYNILKDHCIYISILFSNTLLLLNDIDITDTHTLNFFSINLILLPNRLMIKNSFDERINMNTLNTYIVTMENNLDFILIHEKLYTDRYKNIAYENKYLESSTIQFSDNLFLSIYIKTNNHLSAEEYIELHFE